MLEVGVVRVSCRNSLKLRIAFQPVMQKIKGGRAKNST